jgi:hypothetical protein
VDPYRAMHDYHECKGGVATTSILSVIIVAHFIFSIYCVAAVRNGMESFTDGTIIKEALIVFYFCLAIGIMLNNIGLEHKLSDFIRSLFFNIGATFFCLRLMMNRVYKYWLPEIAQKHLTKGYALYKTIWPSTMTHTNGNSKLSTGLSYDQNGDAPIYQQKSVQISDIYELIVAIENPFRLKILRDLAAKNHLVENVDFICGVLKFKEEAEQLIMNSSGVASDEMRTQAMAMWYQYLQINSPDEVNVSSTAREMLKVKLDHWLPNVKFISKVVARQSLETDSEHRIALFEVAYREILTMLYQNLWAKFRVEEAKALALEDEEDNEGIMFLFTKSEKPEKYSRKGSKKDFEKENKSTARQSISETEDGRRRLVFKKNDDSRRPISEEVDGSAEDSAVAPL